jgi:hypothetical protein
VTRPEQIDPNFRRRPTQETRQLTQRQAVPQSTEDESTCCLGAGNKVWTDMGLKAIEEVQVGDRVLSQDPQTGELAYRPVLKTTVRPASRLVVLQACNQSIVTSGGHLFWVAGDGWVRASEMRGGMEMHALDGSVQLSTVERGRYEPSYNLVVADWHTYFVGEEKPVLCHDNTVSRKTDAVVPGLVD